MVRCKHNESIENRVNCKNYTVFDENKLDIGKIECCPACSDERKEIAKKWSKLIIFHYNVSQVID